MKIVGFGPGRDTAVRPYGITFLKYAAKVAPDFEKEEPPLRRSGEGRNPGNSAEPTFLGTGLLLLC